MINWINIIISVGISLLVAIFTTLITVKLLLKSFKTERWWEYKRETYSKIIEKLSNLKYSLGSMLDEITNVK